MRKDLNALFKNILFKHKNYYDEIHRLQFWGIFNNSMSRSLEIGLQISNIFIYSIFSNKLSNIQ